jgi:hypothetical protein
MGSLTESRGNAMPIITGLQITNHAIQRVRERLVPDATREMVRQWLVGKYISTRKDTVFRTRHPIKGGYEYNDGGLVFVFMPDASRPTGTFILITAYIDGDGCDDELTGLVTSESDIS